MSQHTPHATTLDCIVENIFAFMLPFFLSSAGQDAGLARAAIRELAEAHNPATTTEMELVGRILGFSTVAMDNLRLSMRPGLSDTRILRYRTNAVTLSRAGEQCRKILDSIQARRAAQKPAAIPHPPIEAAPPPEPKPQSQPSRLQAPQPAPHPAKPRHTAPNVTAFPPEIEAMRREARSILAAFSRPPGSVSPSMTTIPFIQDPDALVEAAVKEAMAAARRPATG
jgi:hypothetical protein